MKLHKKGWFYTIVLQIVLLPFILLTAFIVIAWIIVMELVVARFLSKEANEKRNWDLTYWYE